MARKKEYSVMDGYKKKRPSTNFSNVGTGKSENNMKPSTELRRKDSNNCAGPSFSDVYDVADLRSQLGSIGLTLRDIPGDGNCLFRALGDQLEGHSRNHMKHRMDTVRYMIAHRKHFEPFIDIPFERYVDNLSRPGTYAGQDALVAFARLHQVNIVIHQLNSPLWQIEGSEDMNAPELHLSYHNGEHYSSVRYFGDLENAPAQVRLVSLMNGRPGCLSLNKNCSTNSSSDANKKLKQHVSSFASHKDPKGASLTIPKVAADENNYDVDVTDFNTLVDEVMIRSSCRDRALASEALLDNGCDVGHTVDYLISLSVAWDDSQKDGPLNDETTSECSGAKHLVKPESLIHNCLEIFWIDGVYRETIEGLDILFEAASGLCGLPKFDIVESYFI
uniref:OTU domain-containing protein n=1 Tax=Syphacia muris TaxID=451379 RepID=A0A0N5AG34_9BILA